MTVYVDDMFRPAKVGRFEAKWCHLTADTPEELLEFAKKLGLRPAWIQYPGTWKEHFDVTMTVRRKAVEFGAIEVGMGEGVKAMRRRWEERTAAHTKVTDNEPGEHLEHSA